MRHHLRQQIVSHVNMESVPFTIASANHLCGRGERVMLQQGQCYILVYILPGGKGIRAQGEKKIQKKKKTEEKWCRSASLTNVSAASASVRTTDDNVAHYSFECPCRRVSHLTQSHDEFAERKSNSTNERSSPNTGHADDLARMQDAKLHL